MLRYILLAALVISTAPEVLKYESGKNLSSRNESLMISMGEQSDKYNFSGQITEEVDSGELQKIKCKVNVENRSANCSKLGISDINQLSGIPDDITSLDLSFNNISFIDNQAFINFTKLEWLSMNHNKLQILNNDSFLGLSKLKGLDLHSNHLAMSPITFPLNVFKPLEALQRLMIQNNTHVNDSELDYPDEAFANLQALENLHLDGLPNKTLGDGFQKMTSLTTLKFRGDNNQGHCNMRSLRGDMFENVAGVRHLELRHCNIYGPHVDHDVFLPLHNLTYLDVSRNDYLKFEPLAIALNTIRNNTNLKILNMTNIVNPYSPGLCVTNQFADSLPRSLEVLNASSNSIGTLEIGVLHRMPKTLRVVDVSSNKFAFWRYLKDLGQLESLQVLILGGGNVYNLPRYYPPADARVPDQCKEEVFSTVGEPYLLHDTTYYMCQQLPPQLREINAVDAELSNHLSEFHFNDTNKLKIINLDSNNFPVLKGPIRGLDHIQNLSMTGCKIKEIYPTFFEQLGSLEFLNLSYNVFGDMALKRDWPLFLNLGNLTTLDLSFTNIKSISRNAFLGLDKLEFLYLQLNPFLKFNVSISHMKSLKFINFTNTNLVSLPSDVMNALEDIKRVSTSFTIDFSDNIVHCFCSKIKFIKWLATTKVLTNTTKITCTFEDGSKRIVDNLQEEYAKLHKQCASNREAFSVILTATFLVVLAIIGAIVFRFRWKFRYLYYSAIIHYKNQRDRINNEEFEYDIFVSYAHEDHYFVEKTLYSELQKQGLKVYIHGRHFIAGNFITENIVSAVQNSRRTLVVLTRSLLKSQWSRYEIQMANMEQDHTGRPVLLFLRMENLPQLPNEIRMHVAKNTYIDFPDSQSTEREMSLFWSRLVSDLQSS